MNTTLDVVRSFYPWTRYATDHAVVRHLDPALDRWRHREVSCRLAGLAHLDGAWDRTSRGKTKEASYTDADISVLVARRGYLVVLQQNA